MGSKIFYEMARKPVYVDDETKREGIRNYWLNVVESIKAAILILLPILM